MKKIIALSLTLLLAPTAFAKKENFKISAPDSKITWEGKKRIGSGHQGTLAVKSGSLEMDGGALVGGEIVVDMKSLKNTDLTDEGMNKKLVGHLNSDDFFSTDKHGTSTLKITKVEKEGGDKYKVTGDLTIKGIKKPVTFPAVIHIEKDKVHSTATITVDRTAYNIKYNSLKFFSAIGDKAIEDNFTVTVDVLAKK